MSSGESRRSTLPPFHPGALGSLGLRRMRSEDLAAMLGIAEEDLLALAAEAGIRRFAGLGGLGYRISDVARRLDPNAISSIARRTREAGFQIRASKWTLAGYPRLVREFNPTRNGDRTPWHFSHGSNRSIWWKCPAELDHEWRAPVARRTRGARCPFCVGRLVAPSGSIEAKAPHLARQWHPTRNGSLLPVHVSPGSARDVWWTCGKEPDHEWRARVEFRTRRPACPFCAGFRPSKTSSLAAKFPALARQWHPSRNGRQKARDEIPRATTPRWWKCPRGPDHEWSETPFLRTTRETGCPFCRGRRASVTNSLATLAPEVACEWHPTRNGSLRPGDVVAGSCTPAWWKCPQGQDHEWMAQPVSRTRLGTGCPFCAGQRASVTNSLATVRPDLAREWHATRNGGSTPAGVPAGSTFVAWWTCHRGHAFRSSVRDRTVRGRRCPRCRRD